MTQTATLFVLVTGSLTAAERGELDAFARRQEVVLVAPAPTPPSPFAPYRPEAVLDLEGRIDEARTLATSLDEERALAVLAGVERDLLREPELPQAAFLMAERHRVEADVRRRQPGGDAEARELAARAHALEGPRAAAFGEGGSLTTAPGSARPVRFRGLGGHDALEVDGEVAPPAHALAPGTHQVRVLRGDELVFAGWVNVPTDGADPAELALRVRPVVACSTEDVGSLDAGGATPVPFAGARCARWVAVRRVLGRLEVAECTRDRCRPFEPLELARPEPAPLLAPWARAAIAGATTIGTVSLVLLATGVFGRDSPPDRTVFVYHGLR